MKKTLRHSSIIEKGQKRCAAVCAIDPKLDLGEGLTAAAYQKKVEASEKQLEDYNSLVQQADAAATELNVLEAEVAVLNRRILKGVASRYGEDSAEYGKTGGTRLSEAKRPGRKPKAKAEKKVA